MTNEVTSSTASAHVIEPGPEVRCQICWLITPMSKALRDKTVIAGVPYCHGYRMLAHSEGSAVPPAEGVSERPTDEGR